MIKDYAKLAATNIVEAELKWKLKHIQIKHEYFIKLRVKHGSMYTYVFLALAQRFTHFRSVIRKVKRIIIKS